MLTAKIGNQIEQSDRKRLDNIVVLLGNSGLSDTTKIEMVRRYDWAMFRKYPIEVYSEIHHITNGLRGNIELKQEIEYRKRHKTAQSEDLTEHYEGW